MTARALTIAGSDSGGGAGIQADLKTMSALGVFGTSAITAITAQNTVAVTAVEALPPALVAAQIAAVLSDLPPHAVKIGMVFDAPIIRAVAEALRDYSGPIVLDPVMVAKSGDALIDQEAVAALRADLLPRAALLTPNLPEAAVLLNTSEAQSPAQMRAQGQALCDLGVQAVLMKGGHGVGDTCTDLLISGDQEWRFDAPRRATRNTHGTGCTLSSAVAAGLARGLSLPEAVAQAHSYLQQAIAAADGLSLGAGHGPVHHFHAVWPA